ncbi:sulfite exporter TauE/SafE family protein [Basilea psittacipulmonis]|uniref:Probable membrane transporter protein n=1 Tax=Basilea psittacipulmonis DSM 24701 TaxID=1072685 RepID=A0A077DFJ4_9BURK|nr:sulfite exporter TauE/SafE family protein [Basilea psittacipulmonis]AIL31933.1 hypothetical protein IX83_00065 [Basilea psittacipulmonis DSM 24701]
MSETVLFISVCIVGGVFAGLTSGLMGLGGGLVIVPILCYLLPSIYPELSTSYVLPIAIQTSFALVFFNTLTASLHQYKIGNINLPLIKLMGPILFCSALLTGLLVTKIAPGYLKIFFGLVITYLSLNMLMKKKAHEQHSQETSPPIPKKKSIPVGIAVGAIAATAGISGGAFLGPFFHSCKFPIKRALGNASACGVFLSLGGFISYFISGIRVETGIPYSIGYFSLIAFLSFMTTSLFAASYGVKLQSVLPAQKVKKCFAVFILLIATDMIISGFKLL